MASSTYLSCLNIDNWPMESADNCVFLCNGQMGEEAQESLDCLFKEGELD